MGGGGTWPPGSTKFPPLHFWKAHLLIITQSQWTIALIRNSKFVGGDIPTYWMILKRQRFLTCLVFLPNNPMDHYCRLHFMSGETEVFFSNLLKQKSRDVNTSYPISRTYIFNLYVTSISFQREMHENRTVKQQYSHNEFETVFTFLP